MTLALAQVGHLGNARSERDVLAPGVIGLALDLSIRRLEKWKSVRWGFRQEGA